MTRRFLGLALLVAAVAASPLAAADYAVDADRSLFAVLTHRAGVASGLAHDHLIVARGATVGITLDPAAPDAARFAFSAQVLSLDGKDHRSAYGHALLKLQSSTFTPALHLGFVGIFERKAGLKSRIRDISRHRRPHPALHAASLGLIALLLAFGATEAQQPRQREQAAAEEKMAKDPRQVAIEKKLDAIVIPVVDFKDTSIEEAIDFLKPVLQ